MTAIATVTPLTPHQASKDWIGAARELSTRFAARARNADESDAFVAENYADLKAGGFFSALVPAELGGGGADYVTLCAIVRELAKGCGATGLAFSMHSHQVAVAAWRWQNQKAPLEPLLRRVANEQIVILSSGGSDWLESGGRAERVEGGFKITARKGFASGAPAASLLMTSAVYDDPQAGPTVLHFGVPLNAVGVRIEETWRAMGMRGTGSHDIVLDGFFLADAAIGGKRPRGKWHMLFHIISKIAFPIIYGAYTGVAEGARDAAMAAAKGQADSADLFGRAGKVDNAMAATRLAYARLLELGASAAAAPGPETTNNIFIARQLTAESAIRTVEAALELVGGPGYRRDLPIERMFRDVQGARFHPLRESAQLRMAGRLALGRDIDG
jgi:alkylation response protein AidB-like acyl-CoA dehydrogenase